MSSVNNAENTSNTSELTQNLVQTVVATPNNQAIIITTSPEGIPLINRTHRISVDGNVQIELDNTSKAWQYNNEKVVVKQKNAIYISDALSTGFSKIQGFDETQNIDFNDTVFKKYGDIVASQAQYEKGIIKCFLQGKMYTLSEKKEGVGGIFGKNDYDLRINNDHFYARWGSMSKYTCYKIEDDHIIPQKDILRGGGGEVYFLPDGKVVRREGRDVRQIKVDEEPRKYPIQSHLGSFKYDTHHIWMWNENELIVDDEKITLPTTENDPKIKQVAFSPDGKSLLIAVNYKTYGNEQQHKGVYLFFYQDGALVKELPLPTLSGKEIWNLAVDTADENGVSNYACSDNTGNLYFNGHPFEQKRKDIETFTFQDGKLHIRGKTANDQIKDEFISLTEDATRAEKAANKKERENTTALLKILAQFHLTSPDQLQEVVDQAKKAVQIEKNFGEEQNKRRLKQDTLTAKLHEKETKIHQLTGENEEVRSQLETVKKGIQKKTINYGISDEAKKILGL